MHVCISKTFPRLKRLTMRFTNAFSNHIPIAGMKMAHLDWVHMTSLRHYGERSLLQHLQLQACDGRDMTDKPAHLQLIQGYITEYTSSPEHPRGFFDATFWRGSLDTARLPAGVPGEVRHTLGKSYLLDCRPNLEMRQLLFF